MSSQEEETTALGNGNGNHHIFDVQPRPVNVENRLETGRRVALHLLSEDSRARQTDVSSGVLPRQAGRAEVRGIRASHSVKPKQDRQLLRLHPRGSLAPQRTGMAFWPSATTHKNDTRSCQNWTSSLRDLVQINACPWNLASPEMDLCLSPFFGTIMFLS